MILLIDIALVVLLFINIMLLAKKEEGNRIIEWAIVILISLGFVYGSILVKEKRCEKICKKEKYSQPKEAK